MTSTAKDKYISMRVTQGEYDLVQKKAKLAEMTVSKFAANALLGCPVIHGLPELNRQLVRVGTNLNQLTMLCHQGKNLNLKYQEAAIKEVDKVVKDIWRLLSSSISLGKRLPP